MSRSFKHRPSPAGANRLPAQRAGLTALLVAMAALLSPAPASAYPTSGFTIWTIAGTLKTACSAAPCGDGGAATSATLDAPAGVAVDGAGNVLIADDGDYAIRRVDHATGNITTIAGTSRTGCSAAPCGDGGAATSATLDNPTGVAVDGAGNVLIVDEADHAIRRVDHATGNITTIAGTPKTACSAAPCGDGGAATSATLEFPAGVAVDGSGNVLIADQSDHAIRRVDHATGTITTIAGTLKTGCSAAPCGDGGAATSATLDAPAGVAVDGAGNVLIGDEGDHAIRWLTGPQAGPPGSNGANGTNGTNGATGPQGPPGSNGSNGTNGTNGATGPQGPPGPRGATGPAGPAGPGAKVRCNVSRSKKTNKANVTCTVKYAKAAKSTLRAWLVRGATTYASGHHQVRRGHPTRLGLDASRAVKRGRHYTLVLAFIERGGSAIVLQLRVRLR